MALRRIELAISSTVRRLLGLFGSKVSTSGWETQNVGTWDTITTNWEAMT